MSHKPRITAAELAEAQRPGGAWNIAKAALDAGEPTRAEAMLPFMLKSDRKLMEKRIAAMRDSTFDR